MSGASYDAVCPKCGSEGMLCSSDNRPMDMVSGECLECGFTYWTAFGRMSLKEVNELRHELTNLPKLKKLKKQEYNLHLK